MSYFAYNGAVSTSEIDGGIVISEQQYHECIEALVSGRDVAVIDGVFFIRDKQPSPNHEWIDGEWVDMTPEPEPVEPPPIEPHLNNAALARFGGNPLTVFEKIKVSNVLRISTGRYRVTFLSPYPSSEYAVLLSVYDTDIASARVFNRTAAYVEVRTNDALGNPTDLREVTLEAKRVITE